MNQADIEAVLNDRITVETAARILGLSEPRVYQLIEEGQLHCHKLYEDRGITVSRAEVLALHQRRVETPPKRGRKARARSAQVEIEPITLDTLEAGPMMVRNKRVTKAELLDQFPMAEPTEPASAKDRLKEYLKRKQGGNHAG